MKIRLFTLEDSTEESIRIKSRISKSDITLLKKQLDDEEAYLKMQTQKVREKLERS